MRIQDGDVFIGKAGEYDVELTVTKVCKGGRLLDGVRCRSGVQR